MELGDAPPVIRHGHFPWSRDGPARQRRREKRAQARETAAAATSEEEVMASQANGEQTTISVDKATEECSNTNLENEADEDSTADPVFDETVEIATYEILFEVPNCENDDISECFKIN